MLTNLTKDNQILIHLMKLENRNKLSQIRNFSDFAEIFKYLSIEIS